MPIIRPYNDTEYGQQTDSNQNRATKKTLYCFDPSNPLNIFEFGGHSIPDAPEYTMQEPAPQMVRSAVGNYNQTELRHVDDEYIQGEDYTLNIPESRVSLAELIIGVQRRTGRNFVYFTAANDDCPDKCDYFAELRGNSARFGEYQQTTGVIMFDTEGDGGGVVATAMLRVEGPSRKYLGVRIQGNAQSGLDEVYSVLVGSLNDCSDDSFCPYQVGYAFGSDGTAVPAGTRYADKWGNSTTALDGTALGAASLIIDSVFWRGDLYVAYADAFQTTQTAGGVGKSIGGTSALVDVTAITSAGISALVVAGSRLHAFGEGGEWHYTNDGENWTTVSGSPLGSTDIYCAAYNPFTKRIYVGGAGGVGYVIDGNTATLLTGLGSDELVSVVVAGPDHVAFGTDASQIIENFEEANGGAFAVTKTFASGSVNVLLADKRSTNLVAAVGSTVYNRGIHTKMDWLAIGNSPDASVILSGSQGYEEHRRGTDYFVFGTTDGAVFEMQVCNPCKAE